MKHEDLAKWLQAIWGLLNQLFDAQEEIAQGVEALRYELDALKETLKEHPDK